MQIRLNDTISERFITTSDDHRFVSKNASFTNSFGCAHLPK
jgi:hypothetical protein